MTSAPPRRRDARANRDGILSAATATLARDPHASLDAIARGAGLTRRALYGHFADREALVGEVLARGAERFNAIARDIDDPDSRIALARLAHELWRAAAHVQATAAIALDEAHLADTAAALAPLRARVLEIVAAGRAAGELRADVGDEQLARLVEETGRTVIIRIDAAAPDAPSLAVRAVLSIAGLSWRETDALLAEHPDLEAA